MIPAARNMRTRDAPGALDAGKTSNATSRVSRTTNFFFHSRVRPAALRDISFDVAATKRGFICGTLLAEPVTGGDE